MAVLKERQGRGVALAVRLRQSFRRPRGGRAGEARHDEMKNDNNDKCALASRQGHDKSPSVRDERRGECKAQAAFKGGYGAPLAPAATSGYDQTGGGEGERESA